MTASIFREYVAKYLRPTVARIYELINGKPEGSQPKLLHKVMLTEEHTTKDSWDGPSISRCSVSVGDVPMVSSIPLNSRISFWGATSIPKFTIAYRKKESDIKDLQEAIALGNSEAQVEAMLMRNADLCIKGIEIDKEIIFLRGLSTGVTLIPNENSNGEHICIDFGYKEENTFTVGKRWSEDGAKPLSDLWVVLEDAESVGLRPAVMMISRKAFKLLRSSSEGKQLGASHIGAITTEPSNLPVPSCAILLEALKDELSIDVVIVDSTFRVHAEDGTIQTVRPWEVANVVFLQSNIVGRLVWSDCVEKVFPIGGIEYAYGQQGTLISMYHEVNPFSEVTMAKALAIPVIDCASGVFILETETVTSASKKETKAKKERV
jgi:hypothetical protein